VFTVVSVPRIGARSIGASPKGRIRPPHKHIISMEAVMDPAGVPTVCFIRNMKYDVTSNGQHVAHFGAGCLLGVLVGGGRQVLGDTGASPECARESTAIPGARCGDPQRDTSRNANPARLLAGSDVRASKSTSILVGKH
jgi:hypothetical protein